MLGQCLRIDIKLIPHHRSSYTSHGMAQLLLLPAKTNYREFYHWALTTYRGHNVKILDNSLYFVLRRISTVEKRFG
jgi:hypothetical protein